MRSILFVCTANICRSPMAEGVLRRILATRKIPAQIEIDSAATHDYHVGKPPFPSAVEVARRRGYDITAYVARIVQPGDFEHFDAILAMDYSNLARLRAIAPTRSKPKIELLLEYGDRYHGQEVPDPYGGPAAEFERALDMIEDGCRGLASLVASRSRS
jgi:low molecular weight protein-tyrosine phosphatase